MATVALKNKVAPKRKAPRPFGPGDNGILLTPEEFDRVDFEEGYRYELINGVLIVSSTPLRNERDPNEELGHLLRTYRDSHPKGRILDSTLSEETVATGKNRRRADRVIWAGLGRLPRKNEPPTIVAEFVSAGRQNRERDYEEKRKEYLTLGVREYWIIDRFQRILTVYSRPGGKAKKQVVRENQVYRTNLLPGFELPLARLLAAADQWTGEEQASEGA